MAQLVQIPRHRVLSNGIAAVPGAKCYVYESGTTTPVTTYSDAALTTAHQHPVVADSYGTIPPIYVADTFASYKVRLTTSAGVEISTDDNVPGVVAVRLYPQTAEEVAAGVSPTDYDYPVGDIRRYGAIGNGTNDCTNAFNSAIAVAQQSVGSIITIPLGSYYVTAALSFDLPNNAAILCYGKIISSVSAASAVRIGTGSTSNSRFYYRVQGLWVERATDDYAGSSVGIEIRNCTWGHFDIRGVTKFTTGLKLTGTAANGGVSYCQFHLGFLHDNKINLHLTASGTGYCNENIFYGGSFNHSTTYNGAVYTGTYNLLIDHYATNPLNSNRFFAPSLEGNSGTTVCALIEGQNNVLYSPRIENPDDADWAIVFGANSVECAIIGLGWGVLSAANIDDTGSGNYYEHRQGMRLSRSTPADAAKGVLSAQSLNTSEARVLRVLDSSDVEQWYVTGEGNQVNNGTLRIGGAPAAGAASTITLGRETQTTVGAAGGASALPATPTGYLKLYVGTTAFVIPYYAAA